MTRHQEICQKLKPKNDVTEHNEILSFAKLNHTMISNGFPKNCAKTERN